MPCRFSPEAIHPNPPNPPVKKHSTSRGKNLAIGFIALVFGSLAAVALQQYREGGRFAAKLGAGLNQAMIAASKFGMGLGELHDDFGPVAEDKPEGMVALAEAEIRPRGLSAKGEPTTFVAKQCRELHRASHEAFISAKKVEIYSAK